MSKPVILISGASRGLGAAIARAAASLGANVVLTARSRAELEQLAEDIRQTGGEALALAADLGDLASAGDVTRAAIEHFGRLDGLVNNAGMIEPIGYVAESSLAGWQQNITLNLLAPLELIQSALPHLRQAGGRIINISSGAATNTIPGWGAYSSAKAALKHLTHILAKEEPAVTCLSLLPGIVDTQMQATIREQGKARMAEENYQRLAGMHAEGRLLPPEKPGSAAALLALRAPAAWSGEHLAWDDPRLAALQAEG